ncbi:hypothetical protein APS_0616 [Acetobacter pasteurianus subsp. pasteurianus LMG 1262 = NBRC 106471]|nr:hypothetical protein APS_0616 [Acetobacter pasteurianus subsp. pasteurianus LMG 1262 = NBRC 106471]
MQKNLFLPLLMQKEETGPLAISGQHGLFGLAVLQASFSV